MKKYTPSELSSLDETAYSNLPPVETKFGQMLTLAAIQCPMLPKVWYHLASWCFR